MVTSTGVGQYAASETHIALWERMADEQALALVVYCPGSHSVARTVALAGPQVVAARGLLVTMQDMGQTTSQGTFGNSTAQTRIGQVRTLMQSAGAPLRAKAGKVCLLGGSGGVAAALNYARANPGNVSAVAGLLPLTDLQDFYENRLPQSGITQAEVRTAHGTGSNPPDYATYSPVAAGNQAALANIPIKLWYSTDDTFIPVSTVTAYRDAVNAAGGNCTIQSIGAQGHTDTGLDYGQVADFLLANA